MSSTLQLRRGTTASHAVFAGALGEVTFDTDSHRLVTHDGATEGGFPLALAAEAAELGAKLAATDGAATIGSTSGGPGAISTTVAARLGETCNAVSNFGADNTGATNASVALRNFFDHCIATGKPGHIPAGTYLVTAGVLAFDNNFVDVNWPNITTAGYGAVTFKRADATNAPMMSLTNGTATSGVSNTWNGGALGGISFDQNNQTKASNQHGLMLRGVVGTTFGWIKATGMGGSCIHIERKLYGGTNPDPYNVASCFFEAAEGNFCGGAAFYNDNYVGLGGCRIKYVRAIGNSNGAFFGFGAGNTIDVMSIGSCAGWALGNPVDNLGGSSSRFSFGLGEFDDVQYGVDLRRISHSDFGVIRFVHRYNFGTLNTSNSYWPRVAVQCAATAPTVSNKMIIIDRIEAGGAKADLGQFFDFGNAGAQIADLRVQRQTLDNALFGFVPGDYYTNFNANTKVLYTGPSGTPIIDTLKKTIVIARLPLATPIPTSGFSTPANTVPYSLEQHDPAASYNPTTSAYTCVSPGPHRVVARIVLTLPVGARLRMAVMTNGLVNFARYHYSTTENPQAYIIEGEIIAVAGMVITINADQNTAAPVNVTVMAAPAENHLFITQL